MITRETFYSKIRPAFGIIKPSQLHGYEAILDECEKQLVIDKRMIAYILGSVWHECAKTMQPIHEKHNGSRDLYFIKKYWNNESVRKDLGNLSEEDAYKYHGRGYVQITGRANYSRFSKLTGKDLVNNPDLALDPETAAFILVYGMIHGTFTGVGLSQFIGKKCDFVGARKTVNGTDKASLIASYANGYLQAMG